MVPSIQKLRMHRADNEKCMQLPRLRFKHRKVEIIRYKDFSKRCTVEAGKIGKGSYGKLTWEGKKSDVWRGVFQVWGQVPENG